MSKVTICKFTISYGKYMQEGLLGNKHKCHLFEEVLWARESSNCCKSMDGDGYISLPEGPTQFNPDGARMVVRLLLLFCPPATKLLSLNATSENLVWMLTVCPVGNRWCCCCSCCCRCRCRLRCSCNRNCCCWRNDSNCWIDGWWFGCSWGRCSCCSSSNNGISWSFM